jgi:hypothetical protein
MVDFSKLLQKPAGEAKKPPPLPVATFPGVIKSYELGDNNKNKTPYVRYQIGLTGWPEGEEPIEGLDISKRTMRKDYYLTDESLWRLDEFLRSLGIEGKGRGYDEVLPEAVGASVMAEVQQYMNQDTSELGNQLGKVVGA